MKLNQLHRCGLAAIVFFAGCSADGQPDAGEASTSAGTQPGAGDDGQGTEAASSTAASAGDDERETSTGRPDDGDEGTDGVDDTSSTGDSDSGGIDENLPLVLQLTTHDPSLPTHVGTADPSALPAASSGELILTAADNGTVIANGWYDHVRVYEGVTDVTLSNCRIVDTRTGGQNYAIDTQSSPQGSFAHALPDYALKIEHCYVEQAAGGKVIQGGGFDAHRTHVVGGEDGLHLGATNRTRFTEGIIEEQNFYNPSPHADAIQLTTGGLGSRGLIIEDSIIQANFGNSNATLQINVAHPDGDGVISRRNYYHGGNYFIMGDSIAIHTESHDDIFAYATTQHGFEATPGWDVLENPRWYHRQVRPRRSGDNDTGGHYTPRGFDGLGDSGAPGLYEPEGPYPGDLTPVNP